MRQPKQTMMFSAPALFLYAVVYASGVLGIDLRNLQTISTVVTNARKVWSSNTVDDLMNADRVPYYCKMAVNYGELNKNTIKTLDSNLQIVIAATINLFKRINSYNGRLEFIEYIHVMKRNPFLKSEMTDHIYRGEYKDFHEYDFNQALLKKEAFNIIEGWIKGTLINNPGVVIDTAFNQTDYDNIVAATETAFNHFERYEGLFVNKPYVESKIVDISVFRYPDAHHAYFKIFRIQMFATKTSSKAVLTQQSTSGVRGTFESMVFRPQALVLRNLNETVKEKAIKTAKAMFNE